MTNIYYSKKNKVIKLKVITILILMCLIIAGCGKKENPLANKTYESLYINKEEDFYQIFLNLIDEYSNLITEFSNYIELHKDELNNGKKFSSFTDYEEEMYDYYAFIYKIENYEDQNIPADYVEVWKGFKSIIVNNKNILIDAYDEKPDIAINNIINFLNSSSDFFHNINDRLPEQEKKEIKINQTILTDSYEFTLNNVEFSKDVVANTDKIIYSHYEANDGQIYIHIDADIKNLEKQAIKCDEIYITEADYNNGYIYNGFVFTEDTDGDFTYANITSIDPLQTLGVHSLIDCPLEIETNKTASLYINIKLSNGDIYQYIMRQ